MSESTRTARKTTGNSGRIAADGLRNLEGAQRVEEPKRVQATEFFVEHHGSVMHLSRSEERCYLIVN